MQRASLWCKERACDAKSKPVIQMWPRPPIHNQLMHLLHHNIASRAWSYLLLSTPPTPPANLSLSKNIIITALHIHIRTSSLQVRLVSRHGTLHTQDMSSKDNTANADIPDINIPIWFELHRLSYNDVIVTKLQMIGKDLCVEDLKLFNPHHIKALFGGWIFYCNAAGRAYLGWFGWKGPIQLQEAQPQSQEFDRDELWPCQLWQHFININEQE